MKKQLLTLCGAALIILNIAVFFCPVDVANLLVFGISAAVGVGVIILARFGGTGSDVPQADEKSASPIPVAAPPKALESSAPAGAEAVSLLALLQEHGRLVDFASEDISGADDTDIGAAARVVHSGCAKVLREFFTIEPVRGESEGETVTLQGEYDSSSHRLLGSVPNQPPYTGELVHPGWKATQVRLPRISATSDDKTLSVISPAEIQIKSA
jgi:hypothetical protein